MLSFSFDMKEILCDRWHMFYKIFGRDCCAVSVWKLDGCLKLIRIELYDGAGQLLRNVVDLNKCDEVFILAFHERQLCRLQANIYEKAVRIFGMGAFDAAQDEGCEWRPCCLKRK